MRVENEPTLFPRLTLWTGLAVLLCFGLPLQGSAEAFNYEKWHQRALADESFRQADEALNEAYVRAMRMLSKEQRAKLRQEERAWIQENVKAAQESAGREVEVLRERTWKRQEELRRRVDGGAESKTGDAPRLTSDSTTALQLRPDQSAEAAVAKPTASAQSNLSPTKEAAPRPVMREEEVRKPASKAASQNGEEESWTPKVAANLERVYQKSLKDPEFETADSGLRSFYRQAMQVLGPSDREKLRAAEKVWVRQNGILLMNAGEQEGAVLKERTIKRRAELEQMSKERRFQEGASVVGKESAPAPSPVKEPAVLELPVEPLAAKSPEPKPEPAPAPVEAPSEAKSREDAGDESEPGHLTEKGFWMFLASWIFGLTALHYGAFRSVQKNPSKELSRELSPVRLYVLSAGCAGTSLSMLSTGGGIVWTAASVFLTVMGMLVVWYAALAVAVLSRDSADMVAASGTVERSAKDKVH